jgi:hypothetical protein
MFSVILSFTCFVTGTPEFFTYAARVCGSRLCVCASPFVCLPDRCVFHGKMMSLMCSYNAQKLHGFVNEAAL